MSLHLWGLVGMPLSPLRPSTCLVAILPSDRTVLGLAGYFLFPLCQMHSRWFEHIVAALSGSGKPGMVTAGVAPMNPDADRNHVCA